MRAELPPVKIQLIHSMKKFTLYHLRKNLSLPIGERVACEVHFRCTRLANLHAKIRAEIAGKSREFWRRADALNATTPAERNAIMLG
jgi:hypothetical protein